MMCRDGSPAFFFVGCEHDNGLPFNLCMLRPTEIISSAPLKQMMIFTVSARVI